MTPDEIREAAVEIILDHGRDVEFLSIVEFLADKLEGLSDDEEATICNEVDELISRATVTVEWPEEHGARPMRMLTLIKYRWAKRGPFVGGLPIRGRQQRRMNRAREAAQVRRQVERERAGRG